MSVVEPVSYEPDADESDRPRARVRQVFPAAALGPLHDVAKAIQGATQGPFEIAAQSVLATVALVAQAHVDVETLGGSRPVSLFFLTIARSGERKSSCDSRAIVGIRAHERELARDYTSKKDKYDFELTQWTANKKKAKVFEDLGTKPVEPPLPIVQASDPTFEGLVKTMEKGQPSMALFNDEGGVFFGGHAMNRDNLTKTVSGLSRVWDGADLNRTRAGDGATTLRGQRLSLHLMAQPVIADPLFQNQTLMQQGFLARFLISEPETRIGHRLYKEPDPSHRRTVDDFGERVCDFLAKPTPTSPNDQHELTPRVLSLTDAAKELLIEYHDEIEKQQGQGGDLDGATPFASKSAEMAARISGILAFWNNPEAQEITLKDMENGVKLAQYYLSEAVRLTEAAALNGPARLAETLRAWIEKQQLRELVPSKISQDGPRTLRDRKIRDDAIKFLVEDGYLQELPLGTVVKGKSRTTAYKVVGEPNVV